ncbi:hypothetical protein TEA_016784 [Camellia sinensis var. sinensis]|uniref:Receptor ligand binding region domain-containing protein n=1 Tax=Camellia sinensis var. sinensis TaxID=542762 RepID=A0A4S4E004_CAMSN|nr:hypothetical protein TEA_016784 [Camellia sinensis var. sinensis]
MELRNRRRWRFEIASMELRFESSMKLRSETSMELRSESEAQSNDSKTTNIGAIIDANSRIGKEQKIGLEIAAQNFNSNTSNMQKLVLHFKDPGRDPLQAVYAAEELIKEEVQVIVGMETWHEATVVASIGNREQVPILSLASTAIISPPSNALRWPFLVQIATNGSQQVNCIASILQSYKWKKVIAIYEDDSYGSDSSGLALLSESLHSIGTEIEHHLVFPPFSSLSDPQGEAKQLGLVGRDSVWIITDAISSLLDSVNTSVISDMKGALGIQAYYNESNQFFQNFKQHFQKKIRSEYREEDNSEPGIHAIRAYDSIDTIIRAVQKLSVAGVNGSDSMKLWAVDSLYWPGKLVNVVPKGWAMPNEVKKLKIGVPAETTFEMFVKVVENSNGDKSYLGLCIEVFENVVEVLGYDLPYKFEPFHGSCDDLVLCVGNKVKPTCESRAQARLYVEPNGFFLVGFSQVGTWVKTLGLSSVGHAWPNVLIPMGFFLG